jgi:hypothetical protein
VHLDVEAVRHLMLPDAVITQLNSAQLSSCALFLAHCNSNQGKFLFVAVCSSLLNSMTHNGKQPCQAKLRCRGVRPLRHVSLQCPRLPSQDVILPRDLPPGGADGFGLTASHAVGCGCVTSFAASGACSCAGW